MAASKKKLKVYRTAIGFHDAYVATPSKKAALEAWGTTKDLFARHAAELVEDPELSAEPLAHPGEVIKRLRGTTAEQIAALPQEKPKAKPKKAAKPAKTKPKVAPRPSRSALDAAETALAETSDRYQSDLDALRLQEKKLADRRHALEKRLAEKQRALEAALDTARADYEAALKEWRG